MNTNQYYILCCRLIPMLQTAYKFYKAQSRAQKMCCVHTHPSFTSGDWTFQARRAVPAERDTVAAWNVVHQDFIYHSIRTLAWFLPVAVHFSETSLENLPEVYSLLITGRNFCAYTFSVFSVYEMLVDRLTFLYACMLIKTHYCKYNSKKESKEKFSELKMGW